MADQNGKLTHPNSYIIIPNWGRNQTRYSNEGMQHPNINQKTRKFSHN